MLVTYTISQLCFTSVYGYKPTKFTYFYFYYVYAPTEALLYNGSKCESIWFINHTATIVFLLLLRFRCISLGHVCYNTIFVRATGSLSATQRFTLVIKRRLASVTRKTES